MNGILSLLFLIQVAVPNDIAELRAYLGQSYATVLRLLNEKNQILVRNTERLAPAQAAQMKASWKAPDKLPADRAIFPVGEKNVGQGLVSFLFEDDFITEQVNFVFCRGRSERVLAVQVLLDDSRALGGTVPQILQKIYSLPAPTTLQPALLYPFRPNLQVTAWDLNTVEILYQPVAGGGIVTGQLWITDKEVVRTCENIPRIG